MTLTVREMAKNVLSSNNKLKKTREKLEEKRALGKKVKGNGYYKRLRVLCVT